MTVYYFNVIISTFKTISHNAKGRINIMPKPNYNHTIKACYLGYITQAIVNNFVPLIFLILQHTYKISLEKITFLITINFVSQLIIDLLSTKFVDK